MGHWEKIGMAMLFALGQWVWALEPGDIAFVGFDGDGVDALAFVALVDLPPHTELRFCDAPWDGQSFNTKEGDFLWNSGADELPAGTEVQIHDVGGETATVNYGSLTLTNGGGLGSKGENIFAFEGASPREPSKFIAALATDSKAWSNLAGTGLTLGYTAVLLPTSAVAQYSGVRTGLDKQSFLLAIGDFNAWNLTSTELELPEDFSITETNNTLPTAEWNFEADYSVTSENADSAHFNVVISESLPIPVSLDVRLLPGGTALEGVHMSFIPTRLVIPAGETEGVLSVPVKPYSEKMDVYFVLELLNPSQGVLGDQGMHIAYVQKQVIHAPVATNHLKMQWLNSFSIENGGTAEIVAYHDKEKKLYVLNSTAVRIDILDFSDPTHIKTLNSLDMSSYGVGATSVAVGDEWVVATIDAGPQENGKVVFMDLSGNELNVLEVGNLPDMVVISPDGQWVLTANEGQPLSDYSFDAEGSVSMIDVSAGVEALGASHVYNISFESWNSEKEGLIKQGLRIFGPGSTLAQDLEPEYITVSKDSKTAWVSLQENNGMAVLDLETKQFTHIFPLGLKDHRLPGNELDVSDKTSVPLLVNWPVYGLYMPDALANYSANGQTYIISANEGDAREYDALEEEIKVSKVELDPMHFGDGMVLQNDFAMGRLNLVGCHGVMELPLAQMCAMGARSMSIWDAQTGALVYDSGSDFERITAADPVFGSLFNADQKKQTPKDRSDNKGPEPEGVAVGVVGGKTFAFVSLERVGGVIAYDVTDPENPVFESYVNSRNPDEYGGDQGAEGILFIGAQESPTGQALVVTANEVSASIAVFTLEDFFEAPEEPETPETPEEPLVLTKTWGADLLAPWVYHGKEVFFGKPTHVSIYGMDGALKDRQERVERYSLHNYEPGLYLLRSSEGRFMKVLR